MKMTYDKETDAVYIYFKHTVKPGEATDTRSEDDGIFSVDQK
jgi:uncharacterized protein YuzE